jgi:zinc protease
MARRGWPDAARMSAAVGRGAGTDASTAARTDARRFDYVVVPSGSCGGMIAHHLPSLFDDDPAYRGKAERLAAKTHELVSFLRDVRGMDRVEAAYRGTVTYHDSCSGLREMGVKSQPRALLASIEGLTLAEMEKKVRETLQEFEQTGVSDDALARFKSTHESMVISGLETVSGKASQLAQYELMLGNPNQLVNELKRYNDVTKEDVMRVYNKYIKGKSAVILSVYPKGQPQLVAAADNFKYERDYSLKADLAQYEGLSYTKPTAKQDGFDRSKRPGSGPNPTINVPDFWKADMDNGLAMIGAKSDEIPKVYLRLAVRAGHRYTETAKAGIANLFASLMAERTKNYSAEDLDSELEKLGSSIDVSAGSEEIYINVSSLTKNLDRTLALLEEVLFRPDFTEEDFNRKKFEQLEEIANQVNVATTLANNQYGKVLYGEDHIMSIPSIGTTASVEALTLADVKAFYDTWFVANIANLVVVGDVDKEVLLPKLDFLKAWKKNKVVYPAEPATPAADGSKIYLVDKPGAAQSEIRMGYLFMPYDATGEYFRTYAMNFPLGGSFNSRVNLNLREDKGAATTNMLEGQRVTGVR